MPIVDIKGVGKDQFPDNMSKEQIQSVLQQKYYQQAAQPYPSITPLPNPVKPINPSLAERIG